MVFRDMLFELGTEKFVHNVRRSRKTRGDPNCFYRYSHPL